ncbi:unnamed protein product [Spirodela intermedia]|uniref:Uncharacterized protein n=1 Tax=Spirodela intermedia TaxID=51605 RepID=A0A7I8IFV1_SPIIN|nr:unnamed protein product [Spirodela intermedia]CAA6656164.1 unnamed protein product [Spirodela intermedia]
MGGVQEAVSTAAGAACGPASTRSRLASSRSRLPHPRTTSWEQSHSYFCEGDGWEPIGEEDIAGAGDQIFPGRFVFGPPPSREEVVDAVSTIQQTFATFASPQDVEDGFSSTVAEMHLVSSSESESDWIEPTLHLCSRTSVDSRVHEKVVDAFRLLQTNPSIKRTVVSLSSDKAVWEAVMKNEAVQELRESFRAAEHAGSPSDEQNLPAKILRIFQGTTGRMMELVEKIAKIIGGLFSVPEKVKKVDLFEDALRSSFMLSVVVFIVVILSRALRA